MIKYLIKKSLYAHMLILFHLSNVYNTDLNIHTKLITILYTCGEMYKV
jgi:hypothetical protein